MDLKIEGLLVKEALKKAERRLIKDGALSKKVLPIKEVDFEQVVSYTYNRYFKTFVNRSVYSSDEDFSKIIEDLFLSKDRVHLRGGLKNLSSLYTYGVHNKRHVIRNMEGEEVFFTKVETLILHYQRGKNLQNYLITTIKNRITTFKKLHIDSVNKRVDHDTLEETVLVEEPETSDDYNRLYEAIVEKVREESWYEDEVLPDVDLISTLLDLRVDYGLTVPNIANIIREDRKKTIRLWEIVMDVIYEIYQEYDREKVDSYFNACTSKDLRSAERPGDVLYSDILPELPCCLKSRINKFRRAAHV